MDDTLCVRGIKRVGDLNSQFQHLVQRKRSSCNTVLEGLTIHKFHGYELLAVVLADVVNRADIRVIQRRGRLRLAAKAFERGRVLSRSRREKLESDQTLQARVFSLIDDAHPAASKLFEDAVVRECLADERVGASHVWQC